LHGAAYEEAANRANAGSIQHPIDEAAMGVVGNNQPSDDLAARKADLQQAKT
jgi:hypothetical protein